MGFSGALLPPHQPRLPTHGSAPKVTIATGIQSPTPSTYIPSAIGEEGADQNSAPRLSNSAIGEVFEGSAGSKGVIAVTSGSVGAHPETDLACKSWNLPASPGAPWIVQGGGGAELELGFKADGFLGRGSFGKVYGGTYGPSHRAVAVKLLPKDPVLAKPDHFVNKEIEALRRLTHPCIVRLHGVIETPFNVQLFLQRHGITLQRYLAQKPEEAKAKRIAQCVLRGVAHMHAQGFVHRDLKPSNVLLDLQPLAAVVSDLGAAHLGEDAHDLATTLTSRAPEIMVGSPYKEASDLWSLGCILARVTVERETFFHQFSIQGGE